MKRVTVTNTPTSLSAVLEWAQREPVVVQRQERDVAVVLSIDDYARLRGHQVEAFLDARNRVADDAAANGLTDERLAALLTGDGA